MIGLIAPVLVAAIAALALGGSARNWSQQHVRWSPLATCAFVAQVALFFPPLDSQPWVLVWGTWFWVMSMLCVLAMLARNAFTTQSRLRLAWTVAALGVAANVLVVTVNHGTMPRTIPLRADASDGVEHLSNVRVVDSDAPLVWLGDIIAEPDWLPLANVVSVGDLLLSLGLAAWVFLATLPGRRKHRTPNSSISLASPPG